MFSKLLIAAATAYGIACVPALAQNQPPPQTPQTQGTPKTEAKPTEKAMGHKSHHHHHHHRHHHHHHKDQS
jgi:hypothetical protein